MDANNGDDISETSSSSESCCSEIEFQSLTLRGESLSSDDERLSLREEYSSETTCKDIELLKRSFPSLKESPPCSSLSDGTNSSCNDNNYEKSYRERENSKTNLTAPEERSSSASLSDGHQSGTVCGNFKNALDSFVISLENLSKKSDKENSFEAEIAEPIPIKEKRVTFNIRPENSKTRVKPFKQCQETKVSKHRKSVRGPFRRTTTSRATCNQSTSTRSACRQPVTRGPCRSAESRVIVPYYQPVPSPYYQAASRLNYPLSAMVGGQSYLRSCCQSHSRICFQSCCGPMHRYCSEQCHRCCNEQRHRCCNEQRHRCCNEQRHRCCNEQYHRCCNEQYHRCCDEQSHRCCSVQCHRYCNEQCHRCCIKSSRRSCTEQYHRSASLPHHLAEAVAPTIPYQGTAIPNYQTGLDHSYPAEAVQRPRIISNSRQLSSVRQESETIPRRGVVSFPRRRRGASSLHWRHRTTKRNRVASSQNQLQRQISCQFITEEKEQNKFSSEDSGLSDENIRSIQEMDSVGNESSRCNNFSVSKPKSFVNPQISSGRSEKIDASNIPDSGNNRINNTHQSELENSEMKYMEFSDAVNEKQTQLDASNCCSNQVPKEGSDSNVPIFSDSQQKDLEFPILNICSSPTETLDCSYDIFSMCIDGKIRDLKDLTRMLKSQDMRDDDTEWNENSSLSYLHSSNDDSSSLRGKLSSLSFDGIKEYSDESPEGISNSFDAPIHHLNRPIPVLRELCRELNNSKYTEIIEKGNVILSKNTETIFSEEFESLISDLCRKPYTLEVIFKQFKSWCKRYYSIIRNFAYGDEQPSLPDNLDSYIAQFSEAIVVLRKLSSYCKKMRYRLDLVFRISSKSY